LEASIFLKMMIELKRLDSAFNMQAKEIDGHTVLMDAAVETGGGNKGIRPMQMLLMGLGGCASVDILLILKKQKQQVDDFKIEIEGDRQGGKEPSLWENIRLVFYFSGTVEPEKAKRAVDLSMQKYCSVAATLEKAGAKISYIIKVNDPE
jgi:putative redox protein